MLCFSELVTDQILPDEFVNKQFISANGQLLKTLVDRLRQDYNNLLPEPYVLFLTMISKPTAVAGLLQPTSSQALDILEVCCFGFRVSQKTEYLAEILRLFSIEVVPYT